ncbi:hypothetical protein EMCRGX_G003364 [Ephydatia muelleri]
MPTSQAAPNVTALNVVTALSNPNGLLIQVMVVPDALIRVTSSLMGHILTIHRDKLIKLVQLTRLVGRTALDQTTLVVPTLGESVGDARVGAATIVHHHGNGLLWRRLIVHLTEIHCRVGMGRRK